VRFAILGSGSKGNAVLVEGGGVVVLIDVGFAPRELRRRMAHLELDLGDIDAIVLTHAHGDHVKGARQLAGSLGKRTWATEATRRFASTFTALKNHVLVTPGTPFSIGGLSVRPTKTKHDEPGSVCYAFHDGDSAFGYCTDLGEVTDDVAAGLRDIDALMLEFNHDGDMLKHGPYPARLKRRISSSFGHLENGAAADLLARASTPRLERVVCAHLSEVNNTPELARAAARAVVGSGVDVDVAPQHSPTSWLRVRRRATTKAAAPTAPAAAPPPPTTTATASATAPAASQPPAATTVALASLVRRRQLALFGGAPARSTTTETT